MEEPDPSVLAWLDRDEWSGQRRLSDAYWSYVAGSAGDVVPIGQFVLDIGLCGIELLLADDYSTLLRPSTEAEKSSASGDLVARGGHTVRKPSARGCYRRRSQRGPAGS